MVQWLFVAWLGSGHIITCWDNIIVGEIRSKGYISFIGEIQFPDLSKAATCIGSAELQPDCSDCYP